MRVSFSQLFLVAVAALVAGTTIAAAEQVEVRTKTYAISGKNGVELYQSMVRRGPRHGFLSRAIAQTSYTVEWEAEVVSQGSVCRVVKAQPVLSLTYTYP